MFTVRFLRSTLRPRLFVCCTFDAVRGEGPSPPDHHGYLSPRDLVQGLEADVLELPRGYGGSF